MQSKAYLRYLRIAPRKVRLVADLVRGKSVEEAQTILRFADKKGTEPLAKLLKSAVASGEHNFQLNPANLYIAKIMVDEGPKLKRVYPRARGRADQIQKKTSHVTLVLEESVKGAPVKRVGRNTGQREALKVEKTESFKEIEKPKFMRPAKEQVKSPELKTPRFFRRKAI